MRSIPQPNGMRVMVFTPYGPRLEPETVGAVLGLDWSKDIAHLFTRANPHTLEEVRANRYKKRLNILHQYRHGRDAFLSSGFDCLLVVEADVIPPADALNKLAALDADCAYGVYVHRHGRQVLNVTEDTRGRNRGQSLTDEPAALKQAIKDVQISCSGGGLGIVLIKRHVLEAVDFRLEDNTADCDHYFNNDVWAAGYSMKADMSVICGHKKPDGTILWPDYARRGI